MQFLYNLGGEIPILGLVAEDSFSYRCWDAYQQGFTRIACRWTVAYVDRMEWELFLSDPSDSSERAPGFDTQL